MSKKFILCVIICMGFLVFGCMGTDQQELSSSESACEVGQFRTQTQGGWGAKPRGNNPGAYLLANFSQAFPNGVTIGSQYCYNILFTSAGAIQAFLPQNSTPRAISQSYVNPTDKLLTVLAGQTLALTLNVEFDLYDVNFAEVDYNLVDLMVADPTSICYGMSVMDVLFVANAVLGNCPGYDFEPSAINECATKINENFVDGNINNNFLMSP